MSTPPAGPSKAGYWIGGVVIAVGLLGAGLVGAAVLRVYVRRIDNFQRMPLTGTELLTLDPGGYVIYYEGSGVPDHVPLVTVSLVPSGGTQRVTIGRYGGSWGRAFVAYKIDGHNGEGIAAFRIPKPGGDFQITSASVGTGGLAVGRSVAPLLVGAVISALGLGVLALVIGLLVIIHTAVKRGKVRQAQGAAHPGYGYPGGYQYPPGYGSPGRAPGAPGPPSPVPPSSAPDYVWPEPYPQGPNPEHAPAPGPDSDP
ncbi:MAG TPA: hypothetical protein VFW71_09860 [Actinomycetota bacterium]|nr:hypothetical protein [Actinomycetota bacterium]